jgi:hypothetical protein
MVKASRHPELPISDGSDRWSRRRVQVFDKQRTTLARDGRRGQQVSSGLARATEQEDVAERGAATASKYDGRRPVHVGPIGNNERQAISYQSRVVLDPDVDVP